MRVPFLVPCRCGRARTVVFQLAAFVTFLTLLATHEFFATIFGV